MEELLKEIRELISELTPRNDGWTIEGVKKQLFDKRIELLKAVELINSALIANSEQEE